LKAILTRHLSPTNTLGTRIVAKTDGNRKVYNWDYELSNVDNHHMAATSLAEELDWLNRWKLQSGQLHNGDYAHVLVMESEVQQ